MLFTDFNAADHESSVQYTIVADSGDSAADFSITNAGALKFANAVKYDGGDSDQAMRIHSRFVQQMQQETIQWI